ncbi:MAG: SDR family oxidoreductase [Verrucomicrobia bacterium]|nr:SDR family oxidoreductase [Verrucomicrobiota bacterium]
MLSLFDLTGKTALITGAGGYLGSAMAKALAEAGCRLVVTSRDADRAKSIAESLPPIDGSEHVGIALDHMDENSVTNGFSKAIELTDGIDILVNNGNEALGKDWKDVSAEEFNRQLANQTGYFLLSRALREHTVERGVTGSVIMIGSMYGVVGSYPDTYKDICAISPVGYHALKGGIIQMTRHLSVCWAKDDVRVNCLSPGPFPGEAVSEELVKRLEEKCPMGRMGKPDELKGAIVFLASQASSYMTGQNLVIDGGWTAW